jgi:hypothetical protein
MTYINRNQIHATKLRWANKTQRYLVLRLFFLLEWEKKKTEVFTLLSLSVLIWPKRISLGQEDARWEFSSCLCTKVLCDPQQFTVCLSFSGNSRSQWPYSSDAFSCHLAYCLIYVYVYVNIYIHVINTLYKFINPVVKWNELFLVYFLYRAIIKMEWGCICECAPFSKGIALPL